jgi:hypothetical protein
MRCVTKLARVVHQSHSRWLYKAVPADVAVHTLDHSFIASRVTSLCCMAREGPSTAMRRSPLVTRHAISRMVSQSRSSPVISCNDNVGACAHETRAGLSSHPVADINLDCACLLRVPGTRRACAPA